MCKTQLAGMHNAACIWKTVITDMAYTCALQCQTASSYQALWTSLLTALWVPCQLACVWDHMLQYPQDL